MNILNTLRKKLGLSTCSGPGATDILTALKKEMRVRQKILLNSILAPDRFRVALSQEDFQGIEVIRETLCRELEQAALEYVRKKNYQIGSGAIAVELGCNPELDQGRIRVQSEFSVAGETAAQESDEADPLAVTLVIAAGDIHEEHRSLEPGTYLIGRGREADIFPLVEDMLMSRSHCLLTIGDGEILLQDLDSGNGVLVNNCNPVSQARLHPGDCFLCGNTTFCIQP